MSGRISSAAVPVRRGQVPHVGEKSHSSTCTRCTQLGAMPASPSVEGLRPAMASRTVKLTFQVHARCSLLRARHMQGPKLTW